MFAASATLAIAWLQKSIDILLLLIASLGGLYFFWRKANEEHFELLQAMDGVILAAIAGVVGARLGYVFSHPLEFGLSVFALFQFKEYPGLWAVTGLATSFAVMYRYALRQKLDFWEVWDFYSVLLSWYFAWYWLSRFVVGAAPGRPTHLPWGVVFPQRVEAAHPVQLYAALGFGLLFAYLLWVEPRYRFFFWYRSKKRTAKTGYLFSMFLIFSGLIGFAISFVQYPFLIIWDIDLNQVIQALIFVSGCVLLYVRSGRSFFLAKENKPRSVV